MARPTKTEIKERARAKDEKRPYEKLVPTYHKTCPFCDVPLRTHPNLSTYSCNCGSWKYEYYSTVSGNPWVYFPKKPERQ